MSFILRRTPSEEQRGTGQRTHDLVRDQRTARQAQTVHYRIAGDHRETPSL